jgi:hypothetical protein
MKPLHLLSNEERNLFFRSAFEESQIPVEILEKDFWVVWTLGHLFSIGELKTHLTFKGGTSLSKVYGLIRRFSEDIDVSIEKEFLGFGDSHDPEKAASKKKQRAAIEELGKACAEYVQGKMLKDLEEKIAADLGHRTGWNLAVDPQDPDQQTLLFEYPTTASRDGYIRPFVKIEMGARSEHWPVSEHKIQSYVKDALKEKTNEAPVSIRVLNVERTFWEKATILHQYAHLPEDKKLPLRISRHLYDFFCLLNSSAREKALGDLPLLERVAVHKSIYFASSWANHQSARKGTLKLLPPARIGEALEEDFVLMKTMFFGDIPEWKLILKTIEEFERQFNS